MKRTTKEGEELDIKDMSEEHILNCVKKIKRHGLRVRIVYYGYDGDDDYMSGDVEEYRDTAKEKKYLIAFYEELLRRRGLNL